MSAYDPCASTQCHGRECLAHSLAKPGHTSTRQRWELPPLQLRRCAHNQRETCQRDSTTGLSLVDHDVCVIQQLRFDVGVHRGHAGRGSDNEKSCRNARRFLVQPQLPLDDVKSTVLPECEKGGHQRVALLALLHRVAACHGLLRPLLPKCTSRVGHGTAGRREVLHRTQAHRVEPPSSLPWR